ncbi:unnamed protein product [Psylliodes chrysocephalus]|uniref:Uncharacterized protein n=1 Tax=Psylliodes chrysocephalus TaxID=3402493 RepID=A0A9P0GBM1_9CUCU|nr:unnamed protein product [Psylliodes chrysocephala]
MVFFFQRFKMEAMWGILTFALLLSAVSTVKLPRKDFGDNLTAVAKDLHKKCMVTSGCLTECVRKIKAAEFDPDSIPSKKYVACLWTASGLLTKGFELNSTLLEELMPPTISNEEIPTYLKCVEEGKNSAEKKFRDKIFVTTKCIYDTDPEKYIMF